MIRSLIECSLLARLGLRASLGLVNAIMKLGGSQTAAALLRNYFLPIAGARCNMLQFGQKVAASQTFGNATKTATSDAFERTCEC